MNTMYRCALTACAAALATLIALPAAAQPVQRNFPATALRGDLVIVDPPEVTMNRQAARLSPGARIRGVNNMLEMSGALVGAKLRVHYTLDPLGELREVWILSPEEAAKRPWPSTPEEAQTWLFDPVAQNWAKP